MPPTRRSNVLQVYYDVLRRKPSPFPCPFCNVPMLPKTYEKHCRLYHNLNSNICCVWCYGLEQWNYGKKYVHRKHLCECFKRFIAPYPTTPATHPSHTADILTPSTSSEIPISSPPSTSSTLPISSLPSTSSAISSSSSSDPAPTLPKLLPMRLLCQAQCFFQHPSDFIQQLPEALTSLYPVDGMEPPPVPFQDASLQLAASYVQHYLTTRDRFDWMHIMVKAVSYSSFVRAMREDEGLTRILEFSCWCDGGKYPQPKHRQHRHMIIVSIRGHFQSEVWPHVTVAPEDRPCPQFPCKGMKRILSPLHLVHTLGYLSQRRSRCQFTLDSKKGARQNKHFYIFKSLPIEYKKALVTQWEEGLYELLYREKFQNVSVERVLEHPLFRVGGRQWKQKIGDFYNMERGLVLPIEKRFAPTPQPTPHFMYLMNGRKLYFQSDPENESLDEDAWLQKQARGGHCFYENVAQELWTPRPRDQKVLNVLVEKVERIEQLERELRHAQENSDSLKRLDQAKIERLQRELESSTRDIQQLRLENKQLKYRLENNLSLPSKRGKK